MRNYKIVVIAAIIVTAAAIPVFAQTSPSYTATADIFRTDVENSMHVHSFGNVQFEDWVGFVGYGTSQRPASLGFAANPGGGVVPGFMV